MKNRWSALTVIFISWIQFTLNWFNIVPCFGDLTHQMSISLPEIGEIIGIFFLGYGVAHIPGGFISEQFGMRTGMLLGIAVETAGTIITALTPNYDLLLLGRLVCGVGGSIYVAGAIGLTTAWFRDYELVTATGLITGVAFTVGAALGIFLWGEVVAAYGWRNATLIGSVEGVLSLILVMAAFPIPPSETVEVAQGHHLNTASLRRVFGNRNLWVLGLSFIGAYGSYFAAAQLLPSYAEHQLGVAPSAAESLGTILLLGGIPGSFLGGWLADKVLGVMPTFLGAGLIEGLSLLMVPHVGFFGLQICASLIGAMMILAFVGWIAIPGMYNAEIHISDIPTAAGLMLSIGAIGGYGIPVLYGRIAASVGYEWGWTFAAVATLITACFSLFVKQPEQTIVRNTVFQGDG